MAASASRRRLGVLLVQALLLVSLAWPARGWRNVISTGSRACMLYGMRQQGGYWLPHAFVAVCCVRIVWPWLWMPCLRVSEGGRLDAIRWRMLGM